MLDIDSQKTKIRWNKETRSPYVVVRTDVLECHQGLDHNKEYNQRRKVNFAMFDALRLRSTPTIMKENQTSSSPKK